MWKLIVDRRSIADIEAVAGKGFGVIADEATGPWLFTGKSAWSLVNAVCRNTEGHQFSGRRLLNPA